MYCIFSALIEAVQHSQMELYFILYTAATNNYFKCMLDIPFFLILNLLNDMYVNVNIL